MKGFAIIAFAAALLLFGCAAAPIKEGVGEDGRAYRGASSPKVTIVEYSDFECPFCRKAQPVVEEVLRAYPNDVRLVFRHSPLPSHARAYPAAIAAVCAEQQGKFWQMHDLLYASPELTDGQISGYAGEIGLDMGKFAECLVSASADDAVRKDMADAVSAGVDATPTFVIGNGRVRGAQPFDAFRKVIDGELAAAG